MDVGCGTAPVKLAPGVKVSLGNSKPVRFGTDDAPGTTLTMYNNAGSSAFRDNTSSTAEPSCYEIDTGSDFNPDLSFLMGMAAPDDNARMVPVASFEAPRNATTNIKPIETYYISAFSASQGTVIDWKSESRDAAKIDVSAHPRQFGAIVTQEQNGLFTVKYTTTAAEHLYLIQRIEQMGSPLEQKVKELSQQLSEILQFLSSSGNADISKDAQAAAASQSGTKFYGLITYNNQATSPLRESIGDQMADGMTQRAYTITDVDNNTDILKITFTVNVVTPLSKVTKDWSSIWNGLSEELRTVGQLDGCVVVEGDAAASPQQKTLEMQKQKAQKLLQANGFRATTVA
ncbi:hypothetical protein MMC25_003675 [Agyrium rufum]|nr:hypothetical protein [Agyrium rufum]